MIKLQVITVTRKSSAELNTTRYVWEGEKSTPTRSNGAEWEEIEFGIIQEERTTIQIGNLSGNVILLPNPIKLIINDASCFGQYKVGDVVNLTPIRTPDVTQN
jgi:hypothetical protein